MSNGELVLGAVPYANSAVLVEGLDGEPGVRLVRKHPRELAQGFLSGSLDAALVPVFALLTCPEPVRVCGPCIAADGDVRSVLLKCNRKIESVKLIGADPASRTSNALAAVLAKRHFGIEANVRPLGDGELADANVVIGDRALCEPPSPFGDYDLAGAWKAMTGLPFVFAVWASCKEAETVKRIAEITNRAYQKGMHRLEPLAAAEAARLNLPLDSMKSYMEKSIRYRFGDGEREGLRRFQELLKKDGVPGIRTDSLW